MLKVWIQYKDKPSEWSYYAELPALPRTGETVNDRDGNKHAVAEVIWSAPSDRYGAVCVVLK